MNKILKDIQEKFDTLASGVHFLTPEVSLNGFAEISLVFRGADQFGKFGYTELLKALPDRGVFIEIDCYNQLLNMSLSFGGTGGHSLLIRNLFYLENELNQFVQNPRIFSDICFTVCHVGECQIISTEEPNAFHGQLQFNDKRRWY